MCCYVMENCWAVVRRPQLAAGDYAPERFSTAIDGFCMVKVGRSIE